MKGTAGQLNSFHVHQIPKGQERCDDLAGDRSDGGTHHAPLQAKDQDRIKNDIEDSSDQCGNHGKVRASI